MSWDDILARARELETLAGWPPGSLTNILQRARDGSGKPLDFRLVRVKGVTRVREVIVRDDIVFKHKEWRE